MPYITSDSPSGTAVAFVPFANSDGLRWAIRGALSLLALERNWQQVGSMTPAEVAEDMLEALEALVIVPGVPIFSHVERSGSQDLTDEPTQKLEWNNVIADPSGLFDAVSFVWTIPQDGLYLVSCYATTFNDGSAFRLYMYTGGSEAMQIARGNPISGGDSALAHVCFPYRFSEGDIVDFRINPSKNTKFNSSTASPCYASLLFLMP